MLLCRARVLYFFDTGCILKDLLFWFSFLLRHYRSVHFKLLVEAMLPVIVSSPSVWQRVATRLHGIVRFQIWAMVWCVFRSIHFRSWTFWARLYLVWFWVVWVTEDYHALQVAHLSLASRFRTLPGSRSLRWLRFTFAYFTNEFQALFGRVKRFRLWLRCLYHSGHLRIEVTGWLHGILWISMVWLILYCLHRFIILQCLLLHDS